MFKKLISNLPFNPSLINQVSFYAKRLHKEEKLRRLGVMMIVLSLFIQMFAIISPPEPTLAASDNDILRGGFTSRDQAVAKCRTNEQGFATILSAYFYTNGNLNEACDMLAQALPYKIKSTDPNGSKRLVSMGRISQGPTIARTGKPTGEYSVNVHGAGTFYMRNLWAWDSGEYSTYDALAVLNKNGTSILILFNCGNIVTTGHVPPQIPTTPPVPQPPVTPGTAVCTSLVATPMSERRYRFKATTTGNDYTVKSYEFNFGNGKSKTITSSSKTATTDHTYDAASAYTASVKINVDVKGTTGPTPRTLLCQVAVTTTTRDECPLVPGTQTNKSECDVCPAIPGEQSTTAECKPCDNSQNDQDVAACLVLTKTAKNNTQKIENADGTTASADDGITYTLRTKNIGKALVKGYVVEENISDLLDYAVVTSYNGGKLEADNIVRWPATDISPGETVTKQLTIKVKSPIPQTPISASDPAKFDLVMNNVYGNAVNIKLPSNIVKTTETITGSLPKTGPGTTVAVSMMMTIVVSYFFARTRLLAKEMDMVQTEYVTSGSY